SSPKFPKARKSLHLPPFSASSPTGVGAFVEPKIFTRRHVGFLDKKDKNTLAVQRGSYAQAAGNPLSTKTEVPKIANSNTLAKIPKFSKHYFSLNSNFGIGGSSAKAPPIHRGHVRLLALT
ncbi:hypothetical protein DVH24_026945, partial [Malus domestica]